MKRDELPATVARAFVRDMRLYFAEQDPIRREQIAVLQLHSLREHWRSKLSLNDVKLMFDEMRDHLSE
ncbi:MULTISPECIES: hypothetical protein [unclassified Bradyrhizobium]|uniref:hypothetical protein n=1 Tax=unclassified Bradyrhizobium TaxID=2631580 RepID=UPI002916EFAC|nr:MULTISPECIES: hypothetical protein [unclassified Bradyrhizobium]